MADVVVSLGDADLKARITRDAEFLSGCGLLPFGTARQAVFTRTGHAFHDFGRAGVEGQRGG